MAEELTGLAHLCEKNIGGLRTIEYVPLSDVVDDIDHIVLDHNQQVDVLRPGKVWLQARIQTTNKGWTETERLTKQGEYYEQEVRGVLPGHTTAIAEELRKMDGHTYILRLLDRSGQYWILGSRQHPFLFSRRMTTGNRSSGFKGHTLRWLCQTSRPALGYVPVF